MADQLDERGDISTAVVSQRARIQCVSFSCASALSMLLPETLSTVLSQGEWLMRVYGRMQ